MYSNTTPEIFSTVLSVEVVAAKRIYGGGNAEIHRLIDAEGGVWCAKKYAYSETGRRDRMTTEWEALCFLLHCGVPDVPRPIALDPHRRIGVYEWIDGESLSGKVYTVADIDNAIEFLMRLNQLKTHPEAAQQKSASEACFSLDTLWQNLTQRQNRLLQTDTASDDFVAMRDFVGNALREFMEQSMARAYQEYDRLGRSCSLELAGEEWILSPSDFGFHNALRTASGIIWLDFEYFGWDDPAKTMIDFVLHPAMALGSPLKSHFWTTILKQFDCVGDLAERAKILYPLYGIKWCYIMLNEYLVEGSARRTQAAGMEISEAVRVRQLLKAQDLCNRLVRAYE